MKNSNTGGRSVLLGTAAIVGAAVLTLGGAGAAQAHVSASSDTDEAGSYAVVALSVPHGCGEASTTRIAIQVPEGVNSVTPTRNSFYSLEKTMETLETPITDSHGNEVTERVAEVIYTANTPLPHDQRDVFELSLQLPEEAAGSTLYFPTVQTCEEGESAWVQIPAEGQDPHELELPAPALEVVAASDAGHGHGTEAGTEAGTAAEVDADSGAGGGESSALVVTSLVVGGLGLIGAVIALLRSRQRA